MEQKGGHPVGEKGWKEGKTGGRRGSNGMEQRGGCHSQEKGGKEGEAGGSNGD